MRSIQPVRSDSTTLEVPLERGYSLALAREDGGARLCIRNAESGSSLELSIELTEHGPIVRARAAAIDIESEGDISARCERFRVEARDSIELSARNTVRAEGRNVEVEARLGSVQVVANDAVQLLGEQVLLNCEPPPPMPSWAQLSFLAPPQTQAPRDICGDMDPAALDPGPTARPADPSKS